MRRWWQALKDLPTILSGDGEEPEFNAKTQRRKGRTDTRKKTQRRGGAETQRVRCQREYGCPEWSGGNADDPVIAGSRCEARLLRTRAFVPDDLRPGRRARGASVPPWSCLLEREILINVRGEACALRECRPLGQVAGDERLRSEQSLDSAVAGRHLTAGTSTTDRGQVPPLRLRVSAPLRSIPNRVGRPCAFASSRLCVEFFLLGWATPTYIDSDPRKKSPSPAY